MLTESFADLSSVLPRATCQVGKLIGTRGCVINAIRNLTSAEIRLRKDEDGNGTLVVQGYGHQLDQVACRTLALLYPRPIACRTHYPIPNLALQYPLPCRI